MWFCNNKLAVSLNPLHKKVISAKNDEFVPLFDEFVHMVSSLVLYFWGKRQLV